MNQTWILVGSNGKLYVIAQPGTLGGHRRGRIYGRLDCPAALRAIVRGGYATHRVFFLTEEYARAAGSCGKTSPNWTSSSSTTCEMTTLSPTIINRREAKPESWINNSF